MKSAKYYVRTMKKWLYEEQHLKAISTNMAVLNFLSLFNLFFWPGPRTASDLDQRKRRDLDQDQERRNPKKTR